MTTIKFDSYIKNCLVVPRNERKEPLFFDNGVHVRAALDGYVVLPIEVVLDPAFRDQLTSEDYRAHLEQLLSRKVEAEVSTRLQERQLDYDLVRFFNEV